MITTALSLNNLALRCCISLYVSLVSLHTQSEPIPTATNGVALLSSGFFLNISSSTGTLFFICFAAVLMLL